MNSPGTSTGSVIVGVDGSDHADHAIDWAARHAARESRPLVLVHAVDSTTSAASWMVQGGVDPTPYLEYADAAGTQILHQARQRALRVDPDITISELRVRSDPRSALLDAGDGADLLVVGSRGRGPVASLILGSVGAAVVRHAPCPVVVVRPHNPGLVRRGVLVGADGTATSLPVLEFAYRRAAELRLPLTVVHADFDGFAGLRSAGEIEAGGPAYDDLALTLSETLVGLGEKFPDVTMTRHLIQGIAEDQIVALGATMDLVVVGHHRRDLAQRFFFSSVALGVVENITTVVAVVPQD